MSIPAAGLQVEMFLNLLFLFASVAGIFGTLSIAIIRGVFMPRKLCRETQKACGERFCKKVDDIKTEINETNKTVSDHIQIAISKDIWLAESIARIGQKLGVNLEPMPK